MLTMRMTLADVENLKVGDKVFYVPGHKGKVYAFTFVEMHCLPDVSSAWSGRGDNIDRREMIRYVEAGNNFYTNYWEARAFATKEYRK